MGKRCISVRIKPPSWREVAAVGRRKELSVVAIIQGDMRMNFQANMIPGICALAVGALLTFFGGRLCHREKDVPQVKLLGVALAVVGAVMVFVA